MGFFEFFGRRPAAPEPPPPLTDPEDEVEASFREEIKEHRKGKATYEEWQNSPYVADMWRRKEYYDCRQVVVNEDNYGRPPETPMTPEEWDNRHSGPGWEDIKSMLPDATQESVVKPFVLPITQVVVDNRQVVYSLPVRTRKVMEGKRKEKKEEEDEEASDLYGDLLTAADSDLHAQQLCKWTGLFGTAFQLTTYDEVYKRVQRRNLEPWRVQVIYKKGRTSDLQDPETMVCIDMSDLDLSERDFDREHKTVWQVWWRDRWWYEKEPGVPFKDIDCEEAGTNENPYEDSFANRPVKPIIGVKDVITTEPHALTSDMLIRQNQVIDRQLTANNYMLEYQGFAVPVVTGVEKDELLSNPYSAGAPMSFRSPEANFRFANPNARPAEFSAAIRSNTRVVARIRAVDPELVDSEQKIASGVAKAQSRLALAERRDEELPKWLGYEREKYWITSIVWTYRHPERPLRLIPRYVSPLDEERVTIAVEFAPLDPSADPLADSLTNKNNLDMDLVTKPELIASQRKIPLKHAEQIYEENRKVNEKERNSRLLPRNQALPVDRAGRSGTRPQNLDADPSDTRGIGSSNGQGNATSSTQSEEQQLR